MRSAALVSEDGSIDWLCLPRFDSEAVFSKLLGDESHGRWKLTPRDGEIISREYREGSFVLDTVWETPTGSATVTEYMPTRGDISDESDLIREVTCTSGEVEIDMDFRIRFNYGESVPFVERVTIEGKEALLAIAGPNAVYLTGPLPEAKGEAHTGSFTVKEGDTVRWDLIWALSYGTQPERDNYDQLLDETLEFWDEWSSNITAKGPYAGNITRSLLVLRALTDHSTGGIVAAPTTSLPEEFGGERNWDYRYTWLRDSALTIEALIAHGFKDGAMAWRKWLLRALAGDIHGLRIMYGLGGERYLPEYELPHLPG